MYNVSNQCFYSLQQLTPGSRWLSAQFRSTDPITANLKERVEEQYHCKIGVVEVKGHHKIVVNALTQGEADKAATYLEEEVITTTTIHLTGLEMKYLLVKHNAKIQQLKDSCQSFRHPGLYKVPALELKKSVSIRATGRGRELQKTVATVQELTQEFTDERFEVTCPWPRRLWQKWLVKLEKDQEKKDLLFEYTAPSFQRAKGNETTSTIDTVTIPFIIFGPDQEGVQELKRSIEREFTLPPESCKMPLSPDGVKKVKDGLRNHQLKIGQYLVDVKVEVRGMVILSSPKSAADDLQDAKDEIERFLGQVSSVSEVMQDPNPVINQILTPSSHLSFFRQAQSIAEKYKVFLQSRKKQGIPYLFLRGGKTDVASVKEERMR